MRPSNRANNEVRAIRFTTQFTKHAEGSCLVEFGDTKVICTASVSDGVPRFLKNSGKGWLTAEYGMLPRSTHERMQREASRGKQQGRTLEIQRLIGRTLRSAVDLTAIGEKTIHIDCDVIQADGGTRTAAISGSFVALADAIQHLLDQGVISMNPIKFLLASVSVGMYRGEAVVDLDYAEDSNAETDMNVVMNEHGKFIEVQGTAEGQPFSQEDMQQMLDLAKKGIDHIITLQKEKIAEAVSA